MKLSIIGTGYVGLVTGVCLAEQGHDVTCVDIDRAKVEAINAGRPPIHEAGLPELLAKHAGQRLRATTDLPAAVLASELTLVAAPTPFDGQSIDLTFVRQIAGQIGTALREKRDYHVVVMKSTVVPGTTDDVALPILENASGKRAGVDFGVGMNPEFLSEGVAIDDFLRPDRIVLGGIDDRTRDALSRVYAGFENVPVLRTNNRTAEMIKYASNALQATAISFANEIANLCASIGGIDAVDVMQGVHAMKELTVPLSAAGGSQRSDARAKAGITGFLFPGCGFGGSCFPKDVKALVAHGKKHGNAMRLLQAVLDVNADQPHAITAILRKHLDDLSGVRVAVLGLAFKPGTDDVRESPAIPIVNDLLDAGAVVHAYDPIAADAARKVLGDRVRYAASLREAIDGARAVVLVTKWDEFRAVSQLIGKMTDPPLLVDGRRFIGKNDVSRYAGIGL